MEPKLDPWWVTGFTDGAGNFKMIYLPSNTTKCGFTVNLIYEVSVSRKNVDILYRLSFFFNAGNIEYTANGATFTIINLPDILEIVLPHFNDYPVMSYKLRQYQLFKGAAMLIESYDDFSLEQYSNLLSYQNIVNKGKVFFCGHNIDYLPYSIYPLENRDYYNFLILDFNYIAGLIDARASFFISKSGSKRNWPNYNILFYIDFNKTEIGLINQIILSLGCGKIKLGSNKAYYMVSNKKDIYNKIKPFLLKYKLNNKKLSKKFSYFTMALYLLSRIDKLKLRKKACKLYRGERYKIELCRKFINNNSSSHL